jgi:hypothetical protein
VARLFFRGIYFPQIGSRAWIKLLFANRSSIYMLTREGIKTWRSAKKRQRHKQLPMAVEAETITNLEN